MILYEDQYGVVRGENNISSFLLHVDWKGLPFTKTVYKIWLKAWDDILTAFRDNGITEVFSLIEKDVKIMKWQRMFGMSPLLEFQDSILYRRVL